MEILIGLQIGLEQLFLIHNALISSPSLKKKFGIKRNLVFEESRNLSTMIGKKCTFILSQAPSPARLMELDATIENRTEKGIDPLPRRFLDLPPSLQPTPLLNSLLNCKYSA